MRGVKGYHRFLDSFTYVFIYLLILCVCVCVLDTYPLRPCCEGINGGLCGSVNSNGAPLYTVCPLPQKALFWDRFHPTNSGWKTISRILFNRSWSGWTRCEGVVRNNNVLIETWVACTIIPIHSKSGLVCELTLRVNRHSNGQESPLCILAFSMGHRIIFYDT